MNEGKITRTGFSVVANKLEEIAKSADFKRLIAKSVTPNENVAVPFGGAPFKYANANDLVKKFEKIAEQMGMPVEWGHAHG